MTRDLRRAVFLPILLATATHADAERCIGPYRLVGELGSGGMGTVYLGEQDEPVLRQVAVKIVRVDDSSPELVERFLVERQALAVTNHDHVARLYDAGSTPDGEPWFAMEYVPGVPLVEYCDARRASIHDRLALFGQVCDAVQHLHDLGIQHRDLKPDNVLVVERDGRPVPKIIDLGLASIDGLPRSSASDDGLIGTPTHMAPEQLTMPEHEVDGRADVHALGVMLYELLVGVLPYGAVDGGGGAQDAIVSLSRSQRIATPSERLAALGARAHATSAVRGTTLRSLRRSLRGGLDAIARRAVSPDRSHRQPDPAGLSTQVRQHVDRVAARQVSRSSWLWAALLGALGFVAGVGLSGGA